MGTVEQTDTVETIEVTGAAAHIIKRPRLTKILDETDARIILLCAPAGYGKTTLAREWVATRSEPVYWYSGGPAMADVAALAVELAELLSPDEGQDAIRKVRSMASRGEAPRVLARSVGELLARRPKAICVIDDLQHALINGESDAFMRELVEQAQTRFVLTSRSRLPWTQGRKQTYGEAVVIDQRLLAFTAAEAEAVLPDNAEVRHQADGWPAVVGLAALSRELGATDSLPPEQLYDYIASELISAVDLTTRDALYRLALGGDANPAVTRAVLGDETENVIGPALRTGLIARRDGRLTMHPLLRTFLSELVSQLSPPARNPMVQDVLSALTERCEWDAALSLLRLFPSEEEATTVLQAALVPLLEAGRTATVAQWAELAVANHFADGIFTLAQAEVALRQGSDLEAQALAEHAARALQGNLAARAHLTAARAAHQADNWASATSNLHRADELATDLALRTETVWLAYMNAQERSPELAQSALARLEAIEDQRPEYAVRLACAQMFHQTNWPEGNLWAALELAERGVALAATVSDPLLSTNALNSRAHLLRMCGRFDEALDAIAPLVEAATDAGLEFVLDHANLAQAGAMIGIRNLVHARRILQSLLRRSDISTHVRGNAVILLAKLACAKGDLNSGIETLETWPPGTSEALTGERVALAALLLAATGSPREARARISNTPVKHVLEAGMTAEFARVIADRHEGVSEPGAAAATVRDAYRRGCVDVVLLACRVSHDLARAAVSEGAGAELQQTLTSSRDYGLGRHVGLSMPRQPRPIGVLSAREREVLELVVEGRTNPEIAKTLFISESTAKVHVRHIFEKLGVRNRAGAVAALRDLD